MAWRRWYRFHHLPGLPKTLLARITITISSHRLEEAEFPLLLKVGLSPFSFVAYSPHNRVLRFEQAPSIRMATYFDKLSSGQHFNRGNFKVWPDTIIASGGVALNYPSPNPFSLLIPFNIEHILPLHASPIYMNYKLRWFSWSSKLHFITP